MKAGRALRDVWRDAVDPLCATCSHPVSVHGELAPDAPGYAPLAFHCAECRCVLVPK